MKGAQQEKQRSVDKIVGREEKGLPRTETGVRVLLNSHLGAPGAGWETG